MVPGVILMTIGGFGAVATGAHGVSSAICAVIFGTGAGLVLDEFALVLHLDDVYWSEQGRRSVEVVVVTAAVVGLVLIGSVPFGVDELSPDERESRAALVLNVLFNFSLALIALSKGKVLTALFGTVVPVVALVGAIRLARPGSPWARRLYRRRPRARARAALRLWRTTAAGRGPGGRSRTSSAGPRTGRRAVTRSEHPGRAGPSLRRPSGLLSRNAVTWAAAVRRGRHV